MPRSYIKNATDFRTRGLGIRCADAITEWALLLQAPKPAGALHAWGASRSAERDLGRCPKNLQAFEKA